MNTEFEKWVFSQTITYSHAIIVYEYLQANPHLLDVPDGKVKSEDHSEHMGRFPEYQPADIDDKKYKVIPQSDTFAFDELVKSEPVNRKITDEGGKNEQSLDDLVDGFIGNYDLQEYPVAKEDLRDRMEQAQELAVKERDAYYGGVIKKVLQIDNARIAAKEKELANCKSGLSASEVFRIQDAYSAIQEQNQLRAKTHELKQNITKYTIWLIKNVSLRDDGRYKVWSVQQSMTAEQLYPYWEYNVNRVNKLKDE